MQNVMPIGATVAETEISVTGHSKNSNQYTLSYFVLMLKSSMEV